jgi:hypothetical protein
MYIYRIQGRKRLHVSSFSRIFLKKRSLNPFWEDKKKLRGRPLCYQKIKRKKKNQDQIHFIKYHRKTACSWGREERTVQETFEQSHFSEKRSSSIWWDLLFPNAIFQLQLDNINVPIYGAYFFLQTTKYNLEII